MKTILTKVVDGRRLVVGFDVPVIDPVATTQAIDEAIKNDPRFREIKANIEAIERLSKGKPLSAEQRDPVTNLQNEVGQLEREYKSKEAVLKHAVYFHPKIGE